MAPRRDSVATRPEAGNGMLPRLRRTLDDLATVDSTPRRTATALAIGVGLSFSPLIGLQLLLGFGAALAFRLSRVAVLVGLCANVPWIMLPWYALTTAGAAALVGTSSPVNVSERLERILSVPFYQAAFWGHARDLLDAFFWPFLIGPGVGALALAGVTYAVALRVLTRRAERQAEAARSALSLLAGDAEERAADGHVHDAQGAGLDAQ
jgi:uncharacterized protein (DUF2062 family)